mmetsp:Transcript_133264/g.332698  ORF Transcript_133264/g.332698 Transcript_133264/m.332698 type:complete len:206 (+) Transcript_133264:1507-2124(+)
MPCLARRVRNNKTLSSTALQRSGQKWFTNRNGCSFGNDEPPAFGCPLVFEQHSRLVSKSACTSCGAAHHKLQGSLWRPGHHPKRAKAFRNTFLRVPDWMQYLRGPWRPAVTGQELARPTFGELLPLLLREREALLAGASVAERSRLQAPLMGGACLPSTGLRSALLREVAAFGLALGEAASLPCLADLGATMCLGEAPRCFRVSS